MDKTSSTLGLDDPLAAPRPESGRGRRRSRALIEMAVAEFLGEAGEEPRQASGDQADPFSWLGLSESNVLRGARVNELLAEGFGQ